MCVLITDSGNRKLKAQSSQGPNPESETLEEWVEQSPTCLRKDVSLDWNSSQNPIWEDS